jgi:pseudouridine-5'-phosphate glycosidase
MKLPSYFRVMPEVKECLEKRAPVVALETTVVTHGLPYPDNIRLADEMEATVRKYKATPATIGFLDGKLHVGMNREDMERLATSARSRKISKRDFAPAAVGQWDGGTTVSGTLAAASMTGITVFATGGIGGVHHGGMDISADLPDLARDRVIVVCAGAKAILDIPATVEFLETWGVPVIGYKTNEFPAFYSTSSGIGLTVVAESPQTVAEMAYIHWASGFSSALLTVVPPPQADALPASEVSRVIDRALLEAKEKDITGQAVTPFLLSRVSELTGGESKKANLALLKNNARVAAEISEAFSNIARR